MLSHAMVEEKDTEGGCSGLWLLSDCRAEFYGILGLVYAYYKLYKNCSL